MELCSNVNTNPDQSHVQKSWWIIKVSSFESLFPGLWEQLILIFSATHPATDICLYLRGREKRNPEGRHLQREYRISTKHNYNLHGFNLPYDGIVIRLISNVSDWFGMQGRQKFEAFQSTENSSTPPSNGVEFLGSVVHKTSALHFSICPITNYAFTNHTKVTRAFLSQRQRRRYISWVTGPSLLKSKRKRNSG